MKQTRKNLITAALAVSTAISVAAANATDHRIWREQVPLGDGPAIELKFEAVAPTKKRANGSLPWQEQVNIVDNHRVFIPEPALNRHGKSGGDLMWREQVRKQAGE